MLDPSLFPWFYVLVAKGTSIGNSCCLGSNALLHLGMIVVYLNRNGLLTLGTPLIILMMLTLSK